MAVKKSFFQNIFRLDLMMRFLISKCINQSMSAYKKSKAAAVKLLNPLESSQLSKIEIVAEYIWTHCLYITQLMLKKALEREDPLAVIRPIGLFFLFRDKISNHHEKTGIIP